MAFAAVSRAVAGLGCAACSPHCAAAAQARRLGSKLIGPMYQDSRGVSRVRINRFTGVNVVKVGVPKTEWQIAAEKEFLAMRDQVPKEGYINGLTPDDVRNLSPEMRHCLSLTCASGGEIARFRKAELRKKFQRNTLDTNSKPVRIACLTEKILTIRAHLLRHPRDHHVKPALQLHHASRMKTMKSLYKSDFTLYRHVCTELGIRMVRFAIPMSRDPRQSTNPQAVDGDKARFLIRQRMYHARFRPRKLREPGTGRYLRYTRHPMEPVPASHGKAPATAQQISKAWPYGVRQERTEGKQIVYNPTAPGPGFWPAKLGVVGGRTLSSSK